jgi:hypothetical protein
MNTPQITTATQTATQNHMDVMLAALANNHNAEVIAHKGIYARKFPNTVAVSALATPATSYPIKSYRFDYWAAFYVRLETYLTYGTGQLMQFHGSGGGVGVGTGIFAGANSGTYFYLPPNELPGDCSFYFQPTALGGLVHFWRGDVIIGTLAGAGVGGIGAFGGTGTWSVQ